MNIDIIRLYSVICLIILANVWNMIFPKGMGYEVQTGFVYEFSKYIYGLVILLMLPSLYKTNRLYFWKMRYMALYLIAHIIVAYVFQMKFELGNYLKTLMICLSFIFFEEILKRIKLNDILLYTYILSIFVNIVYLTLTQNRLEIALENAGHISGGQNISVSLIFLLPLIFYTFSGRVSSYMFLIIAVSVLVSMRRTAMLAYLFCLPFVYKHLSKNISKKTLLFIVGALALGGYYIYTNYWYVLADRFSDMYEASNNGYYGSGRTGWWEVLLTTFINSPQKWIQGFGAGQVSEYMSRAGFPFVNAHNDYLEIGFTYGIIGLYLWFGSIIDIFKLSFRKGYKKYSGIIMMSALSYLFISLVSGATQQPHFICVAIFSVLMIVQKSPIYSKQRGFLMKIKKYIRK